MADIVDARSSQAMPNKALFLDRDGVLIEYVPYLSSPSQVQIPEKAGKALKKWQDCGYLLIVVTNQSGIGRGYFTVEDVASVHHKIIQEYKNYGVKFTDIITCPHTPEDRCKCRKPSPYMLFEAARRWSIDLSLSYMIGDSLSDIECGKNAGCKSVLVKSAKALDSEQLDCTLFTTYENLAATISLIPTFRTSYM